MIIVGLAPEQKLSALEQKNSHSRKKDAREAQHREVCRRRTPWSHCSCISLSVDSDGLGTVQWRSTGASCRPGSSPPQRSSRLVRAERAHDPRAVRSTWSWRPPPQVLRHAHHYSSPTSLDTISAEQASRTDPVQNAPRLARDTSTPRTHRRAHGHVHQHTLANHLS